MDTQASGSLPSFLRARWFAVNVLGSHQGGLSTRFGAAVPSRFADLAYTPGLGGCPVLHDGLAHFERSNLPRPGRADEAPGWQALLHSGGGYCGPAALQTAG